MEDFHHNRELPETTPQAPEGLPEGVSGEFSEWTSEGLSEVTPGRFPEENSRTPILQEYSI